VLCFEVNVAIIRYYHCNSVKSGLIVPVSSSTRMIVIQLGKDISQCLPLSEDIEHMSQLSDIPGPPHMTSGGVLHPAHVSRSSIRVFLYLVQRMLL
jgi:hypothetical protein